MVDTAVTPVTATTLAGSASAAQAAPDMSLIGLFLHADPLVQAIMAIMILMSIVSWGIIIDKAMAFKALKAKTDRFEEEFWSAEALDQFYARIKKRKSLNPMAAIFVTAMDEWGRSRKPGRPTELTLDTKERMLQMMHITRNRELDKIEGGLGFLASAGSASPFIGLLGTVLGIMNSFTSIAGAQNTTLAVVAPGIAEALFATAIGLFVAIPAVIAYNRYSQLLARFSGRLEDFSSEFAALLSRQSGS
jgi:biopolymer transport protein TolQ